MQTFLKGFRSAIFVLALIALFCSLFYLLRYEYTSMKTERDFKSLKTEDGVDLEALKQRNEDLIGWIHVDDTRIDYPVMWTPDDPQHYLRLNFNKEYSVAGVPFLDAESDPATSKHLLIYGHHMNSGTMFYDLDKFRKKEFWEEHPVVQFDTVGKEGNYRVFAVCYTDVYADGFRYHNYPFIAADDKETFDMYVKAVKDMSLYDTGITPEYGDTILTLSTCNHERGDGVYRENGRLIVVAVKVFDYER